MFTTLIEPSELYANLSNSNWVVVDCRFQLDDTDAGEKAYRREHIPGAVYAHLDRDLSGPPATDHGRHPLPTPAAMTQLFSRLGIKEDTQVVAYDDARGVFASRLWWMLNFMGHENVSVLNGGIQKWVEGGLPIETDEVSKKVTLFTGQPEPDRLVVLEEVLNQPLLIDSRAPDRYAGLVEPLDDRAGHIPGAVNYYYEENYDDDGRFLTADELQEKLSTLFSRTAADEATFYCGSGVSACVNILAVAHAGLGEPRLYVGSWSEWSQDPQRPIESVETSSH